MNLDEVMVVDFQQTSADITEQAAHHGLGQFLPACETANSEPNVLLRME